jgi:hypothetical protein
MQDLLLHSLLDKQGEPSGRGPSHNPFAHSLELHCALELHADPPGNGA